MYLTKSTRRTGLRITSAGQFAPCAIHCRSDSICDFASGSPLGGITSSLAAGRVVVVKSGLSSGLPGTSAAPLRPPFSAPALVSRRKSPLGFSGPWQLRQADSRIGLTSRRKSTGSAARIEHAAKTHPAKAAVIKRYFILNRTMMPASFHTRKSDVNSPCILRLIFSGASGKVPPDDTLPPYVAADKIVSGASSFPLPRCLPRDDGDSGESRRRVQRRQNCRNGRGHHQRDRRAQTPGRRALAGTGRPDLSQGVRTPRARPRG